MGVELCGQQLVLFRNAQGKVNCLSGLCPHRGAPLHMGWVAQAEGRDCVVCPYHGEPCPLADTCVQPAVSKHRLLPCAAPWPPLRVRTCLSSEAWSAACVTGAQSAASHIS